MGRKFPLICAATLCMLLMMTNSSMGQVSVDPHGFSMWVELEDTTESSITIQNDYDFDVDYRVRWRKPRREEAMRIGPQRDDPGDVIHELILDYHYCLGFEWDPEEQIMWASHATPQRIVGYRWDGEEITETVSDFGVPSTVVGAAYHEGIIYAGKWDGTGRIYRYDADGEALGELETGFPYIMDLTVDHERGYLFAVELNTANIEQSFHMMVYDINDEYEEVGVVENLLDLPDVNYRLRLCWVPEHDEAPLWVSGENYLAQQIVLDDEWNYEIVNEIDMSEITDVSSFGLGHDGENLWVSTSNSEQQNENFAYVVDDGINELPWFTADPAEGRIGGGESAEIGITVIPIEVEEGVYEMICRVLLSEPNEERDQLDQEIIEITALMVVEAPVAQLSGTVTDPARENAPVENVTVSMDRYTMMRMTDEEGLYDYLNLPVDDYVFTFTAPDYLPNMQEVSVEEEGEIELNVEMFHAEFNPEFEDFNVSLEPGFSVETTMNVSNDGNGTCTYSVERQVIVENPAQPWEMVGEIQLEEMLEDDAIQGVEFVDGLFYVCGGLNNDAELSKIYILNADGELQGSFDQFKASRYGMRDLAWDGEWLWGVDGDSLYGFTIEGELQASFEAPRDPCRSVTWDPGRELLWVADVTSDAWAMTRDGEIEIELDRPDSVRFYGMAFWPDDPDNYGLFAFSRLSGDEPMEVFKINPENGDYIRLAAFPDLEGRPAGTCITSQLDPHNWLFMALVQSDDRIVSWNLETRRDWFTIEPVSGEIPAGDSQDFSVVFNATGLPIELYEGEFIFSHDGVGSQTIIPVSLDVVEGEVHTTRDLTLNAGWNAVSLNLQPDIADIEELFADLIENDDLIMMKDGDGHFFAPGWDVGGLENWSVDQGYQMKMRRHVRPRIEGWSVLADEPIELENGWNFVSYYPRAQVEASYALSNINEYLDIVKDGNGNFYVPSWEFSNIGDMCEGQGYFLNVVTEEPIELVYMVRQADERDDFGGYASVYRTPGVLPVHANTGENMSLLVLTEDHQEGEIAVFVGDHLAGSGIIRNGACGIAVWADDPLTVEIDGARDGDQLDVRLFENGDWLDITYETLRGDNVYKVNSLSVIRLEQAVELPVEFGIDSAYPNPFNSRMRLTYSLPEGGNIELALFDLAGRLVRQLATGQQSAGTHTLQIDAGELSSGLYIVRLEGQRKTAQTKIALIK